MSSRALRKLMEPTEQVDEDTEELVLNSRQPKFSLLTLNADIPLEQPDVSDDATTTTNLTDHKKKKRKKKKQKQSSKPANVDDDDDDLIFQDHNTPSHNASQSHNSDLAELFKVNVKLLDHAAEMSRIFGSGVVNQNSSSRTGRTSRKRGSLVQIKPIWPLLTRLGLDMEKLEDDVYTYTFTKQYQLAQKSFHRALSSMNPDNLTDVLSNCSYHIDALLQLSEIMMRQDNSEIAVDLLERVLHAFQCSIRAPCSFLTGTCRLDFKRQINRGLFVALFRYILVIGERGCYRSALEYCKLLLSLDPEDPLAVLLMIDYYAIFSGQYEYLLELYKMLNPSRNLSLLPNFALSVALAHKLIVQERSKSVENLDEMADKSLQDALIMFPGFMTRLLKKTPIGGISNLDKSVLFGKEVLISESESLGCLLSLYVARMHPIWTSNDVLPWLEKNVEKVLTLVEPCQSSNLLSSTPDPRLAEYSTKRQTLYPSFPRKILRHLVLVDLPEAPLILPPNLRNTPIYSFDPFPPRNSIDIYDAEEERRQMQSNHSNSGVLGSFLASLLPSYSIQQAQNGPIDNLDENEIASSFSAGQIFQAATERLTSALRQALERIDLHSTTVPSNTNADDDDEIEGR